MLDYLIYLIFILSVALAAGGVVISSKMRNSFRHEIFSTLLYYQVFIYTFGFYGIWGQVAIKAFLAEYISPELLNRFSDIAILMGIAFPCFRMADAYAVFTWIFQEGNVTSWFVSLFLLLNFSILLLLDLL